MTKPDDRLTYYVYDHFDPVSGEVVYIGLGTMGRAWEASTRTRAHKEWCVRLSERGYTPDQYVRLRVRGLRRLVALQLERRAIEMAKPRFNVRHASHDRDKYLGMRSKVRTIDTRDFELVNNF